MSDGENPDIAYVPRVGAVGVIGPGPETELLISRCASPRRSGGTL